MIEKLKRYFPLIVVAGVAFLMSLAVPLELSNAMMGFFLCLLAMLKLFNISGFADGFQMYDVIAKHCRPYALVYPFMELSLGLLFLSNLAPLITNSVTLGLMVIGLIGVIRSLRSGMNVKCACLGTNLNVPLSTVTIVENVAMGLMAFFNLISKN